jgi:hypothetical protein
MAAAEKTLDIDQGATFYLGFTWYPPGPTDPVTNLPTGSPHDLTGCSARMQIRRKQGQPAIVTATSADPGDPIDPLLVEQGAGRIKLGGVTGRIEITLTDEDTDLLDFTSGVYDLEVQWPLEAGDIRPRVDRVLQGSVTVDPNVTQVDGEDPVVT